MPHPDLSEAEVSNCEHGASAVRPGASSPGGECLWQATFYINSANKFHILFQIFLCLTYKHLS